MIFLLDTGILPLLYLFLRTEATKKCSISIEEPTDDYTGKCNGEEEGKELLVPFKPSIRDDDDTVETIILEEEHDGTNSTISASTTLSSSSSTSCCSKISLLEIREREAMDTLYEHMEIIFQFFQNAGVTNASIFELKQQLFSKNDVSLVLERTQEYILALSESSSLCSSQQDDEHHPNKNLHCILELLKHVWMDGLTLLTLQHKSCYLLLQEQKYLSQFSSKPGYVSSQDILQTQEQVCLKAEQITQCQTQLIKLKSIRKRIVYSNISMSS